MFWTLLALGGMTLVAPAHGQDSAAAQKVCKKPELRERMSVPAEDLQNLAEATQSYIDCVGPQIEALRTKATTLMEEAKKAAEASNAAATEVNAFIEAYRAFQAKHKNDK